MKVILEGKLSDPNYALVNSPEDYGVEGGSVGLGL